MKEIVLLVIALFVVSNIPATTEAKLANDFSVDIIHRDSPLSPFYNSSMNQMDVLRGAALRSIARSKSLSHHFTTLSESKAETVMIPNGGDYLMKIFIGTPPKESLVLVDTTSSLVWVQCWPCSDCFKQDAPLFNPTKSVTYKLFSCHSDSCDSFKEFTSCGQPADSCRYSYGYRDGSNTIGDLAKDVIGFGSNGGMTAPVETIFGCGRHNKGVYSGLESGIAGLGPSNLSLVSQLSNANGWVFSYCLNPPHTNKTNKLTFQPQPTLFTGSQGVVSTPMQPQIPHEYYFLRLEGISINEVRVPPTLPQSFDMVIDLGSILTYLETRFYEAIEIAVVESIDDMAMRYPPSPYRLCYRAATKLKVPDVTFHFNGGADIRFPTSNMFLNVDETTTCFMILPHARLSILGNIAQVNFKVEFDLVGRKVSFAPTNCSNE